jgi:hypothetical protein
MQKPNCIFLILALLLAVTATSPNVYAQQEEASQNAFDPFIDYNEYESDGDEEADINFFKNGRLLTMGLTLGQRFFTDGLRQAYKDDITYGVYLSYFFDLRFALQFGYQYGSHTLDFTGGGQNVTGTSKIGSFDVLLKYYMNTQNVTKGLAELNPYLAGGLSYVSRELKVSGEPEFSNDTAPAFNLAVGLEIPMMNNKSYFGIQAMYQLVSFDDEGSEVKLQEDTIETGKYLNGDLISIVAILGFNF